MVQASSDSCPECRYTFDGSTCNQRGSHFCEPRAMRAEAFIEEVCVHTKSVYARKAFVLEDWQRDEIIYPLFGVVRWDDQWNQYVRQYTVMWMEVGRGNGKSELDAAIVLLLLVGDDEESAEVYGAAKDTKQAGKVGEVVKRMYELSPALSKRLAYNKAARRLYDAKTNSYYEVIPGDAEGELGHNAYGAVIDEVLTQADAAMWNTLRTAQGKRPWSLLYGSTTAGNDPSGFAALQHEEMFRIMEEPRRSPHTLVFQRCLPKTDEELDRLRRIFPDHPDLPVSTDPFDERNWRWPNPALGTFLSVNTLREEAIEAKNEPTKENAFRQFRCNQWVSQASRWMPLHLWDRCTQRLITEDRLAGRRCYGGLDLAATTDLAAVAWLFEPEQEGDPFDVLWRVWTPEAQVPLLDRHTGGAVSVWAREGLITVTPGDWIDYNRIHAQISADADAFEVITLGYDPWNATKTVQDLARDGMDIVEVRQGFRTMSPAMKELMRLVKMRGINTGGHPVARWNADSIEAAQDPAENIKPVKPKRATSGRRIDLMVALLDAIHCWQQDRAEEPPELWAEWA